MAPAGQTRHGQAATQAVQAGGRLDPEAAWTAVLARDAVQDGAFVYAVRTTGVYCRPSCPSRRPLRRNVGFFETPDVAERAGFRACQRCHPRELLAPTAGLVEKVRLFIEDHLDDRITLSKLARHAGLSAFHLQRTFKRVTGLTPAQYAAARRAERFRHELKRGANVTRATYDAGYGSSSRLYSVSNAQLGMTPSAYRRGGQGMHIRYATTATPFGRLLVGATDRGICAVQLADDDAALEAQLASDFPLATRERAAGEVDGWMSAVLARLDGPQARGAHAASAAGVSPVTGASVPAGGAAASGGAAVAGPAAAARAAVMFDVHATEFKWRVWRALQEIPYGETRSYGQIAAEIGAPRAVRAVANACATNQAAIVIPCHRVIGANGALAGYRWGLDRKRRLLAHERAQAAAAERAGDRASRAVQAASPARPAHATQAAQAAHTK